MEDENTGYQTIGPVSKMFNMVCRWHREGPESDAFQQHCAKIDDFLWMSDEGLMMTGTNGSQLWDAAFISQALVETGLGEEEANKTAVKGVLDWLDKCQIRENPKHYDSAYRHASKGAWPFSTPEQGYTVSETIHTNEFLGLYRFNRTGQRLCRGRTESGNRLAKP
jgi:lanosterol synthase